jgi:hypothetical protein
LTKVDDFIPYGTHSNLFQMDVSVLFSPPRLIIIIIIIFGGNVA